MICNPEVYLNAARGGRLNCKTYRQLSRRSSQLILFRLRAEHDRQRHLPRHHQDQPYSEPLRHSRDRHPQSLRSLDLRNPKEMVGPRRPCMIGETYQCKGARSSFAFKRPPTPPNLSRIFLPPHISRNASHILPTSFPPSARFCARLPNSHHRPPRLRLQIHRPTPTPIHHLLPRLPQLRQLNILMLQRR